MSEFRRFCVKKDGLGGTDNAQNTLYRQNPARVDRVNTAYRPSTVASRR